MSPSTWPTPTKASATGRPTTPAGPRWLSAASGTASRHPGTSTASPGSAYPCSVRPTRLTSRCLRPCCCTRHELARTTGEAQGEDLEILDSHDDGLLGRAGDDDDGGLVGRGVLLPVRHIRRHPDVVARARLQPDQLAGDRITAHEHRGAGHDVDAGLGVTVMMIARTHARWQLRPAHP